MSASITEKQLLKQNIRKDLRKELLIWGSKSKPDVGDDISNRMSHSKDPNLISTSEISFAMRIAHRNVTNWIPTPRNEQRHATNRNPCQRALCTIIAQSDIPNKIPLSENLFRKTIAHWDATTLIPWQRILLTGHYPSGENKFNPAAGGDFFVRKGRTAKSQLQTTDKIKNW